VSIAETAGGMTQLALSPSDLQVIGRDNAAGLLARFKV
jgi:hypothetical protein